MKSYLIAILCLFITTALYSAEVMVVALDREWCRKTIQNEKWKTEVRLSTLCSLLCNAKQTKSKALADWTRISEVLHLFTIEKVEPPKNKKAEYETFNMSFTKPTVDGVESFVQVLLNSKNSCSKAEFVEFLIGKGKESEGRSLKDAYLVKKKDVVKDKNLQKR